jgi:branched-subunit amino acid aminotransferase/4-amino-4-deoxychorismate lyase
MEKINADMSSACGSPVSCDPKEDYELLESLLWTQDDGYFVLPYHRERVWRSSCELGFQLDLAEFDRQLQKIADRCGHGAHKVRVRVSRGGDIQAESRPVESHDTDLHVKVGMSRVPVNASDPFLRHKTTRRTAYVRAADTRPDCDDVILYNERGEITESCIANVVIVWKGKRLTPAVECGLLAGTFRAQLIDEGIIEESVISIELLTQCDKLYLINSVRKWIRTEWVPRS